MVFFILDLSPPGPADAHSYSVWAGREHIIHPGATVTGHRHEGDDLRIIRVHSSSILNKSELLRNSIFQTKILKMHEHNKV